LAWFLAWFLEVIPKIGDGILFFVGRFFLFHFMLNKRWVGWVWMFFHTRLRRGFLRFADGLAARDLAARMAPAFALP
jgi:hypothetical protein